MAKKYTSKKTASQQRGRKAQQSSLLTWIVLGVLAVLVVFGIVQQFSHSTMRNITVPEITVQEAYQKFQAGALILDVRTPQEWAQGHIPNATLIPLDELESRLNELPKDREIVVICHTGNRSREGAVLLLKAGFTKVDTVIGGMNNWQAAGY
ncbi:MAG: rhodanese-like domain-containing protein, partial [Anaerolineales bacterium]